MVSWENHQMSSEVDCKIEHTALSVATAQGHPQNETTWSKA